MKSNHISRRSFLEKSSCIIASPLFLRYGFFSEASPAERTWGIILNTVRNEMKADYKATLKSLADMGYTYLEGGYYGDSATAYASYIQSLGLKSVIGGSSMGNLLESLDEYLRNAETLQQSYITCYWPWLSSANDLTYDECMEAAERLNDIGKQIKKAGYTFTWHNHDKEFVNIGDQTAFDLIMENTDEQWVKVQLDLYWVYKGNHNPIDLFRKYPGRFDLVHVKDMDDTEDRAISCVGEGIIDFQAIFDQAELAGIQYATVEHEKSIQGIRCAQVSIEHLEGIKW